MGRKSKRKKLKTRDAGVHAGGENRPAARGNNGLALFLSGVVRWGAYIALFAPLVVSSSVLFPFVVTKTVFFWIFAEVVFAAWVLLALNNQKFRPKWNALTVLFSVFIFTTILTSFTGVNIERSFWSTVERMAGTINWLHLFIFFLALSSTFKSAGDWRKLLSASLIASSLVSLVFLLERVGVSVVGFDTRSGSTIGNSSFMSAYLLFNVFFGVWLVSQAREFASRVAYGMAVFLVALTILLSTAFGALMAMLGGFFLLLLAWLFFRAPIKLARPLSLTLLTVGAIAGTIVVWATFTQDARVVSRLPGFFSSQETIQARKVVWGMAVAGVKERPVLGWGPENFNVPFAKYFNPCLTLNDCGNEVWFDRTHNIILDHLVNSGVIGLLSYLAVLLAALFVAWKKFLRSSVGEPRDWVFPVIVTTTIVSYVAQNMLVFDMPNTYLMFALTLSFTAALSSREPEEPSPDKAEGLRSPNSFSVIVVLVLLAYYLFSFGFQSLQAAYFGVTIARGSMPADKILQLYRKSLSVSPVGNRQVPEFFTMQVMNAVGSDGSVPKEFIEEIIKIMEDTIEKNPLDYRRRIILGNFYNIARNRDETYLAKAEEVFKESLVLSPTNQQSYFSLVENYYFQGRGKEAVEMAKYAVALEPRFGKAHWFLSLAYEAAGEEKLAEEALAKAADLGYSR